MIELTQITKRYGDSLILKGISWQIAGGQFALLLGDNGAGKSTLLRILATQSRADEGTVKIGGWPLPSHAERVRPHIGVVAHTPLLYADLTAEENLRFFAQLYGVADEEQAVKQSLQKVGLWRRSTDVVRTFSRGMVQRLALARAFLHRPTILLLDEPYTGLDVAGCTLLDELLADYRTEGGTVVMVTHDWARLVQSADNVAILRQGRVAWQGCGAEDVITRYHARPQSETE